MSAAQPASLNLSSVSELASNFWSEDKFSCLVCLDLLKDPVAIPCGHSYCMGCIKNCWDQTDHTAVYSCPRCRETFTSRPVLGRNTMLVEVVGEFKRRRLNPPPAQGYAGPGDVPCDFCTGRKFKAVNSCLTCLSSHCQTHVKPHLEAAALTRHKLIDATGNLEQKICAEYQKVLEVFCRTDQSCICVLCIDKEHKSHDIVSAVAGRQEKLGETQTELELRIQEGLKELEELKQAVESLKRSSQREIHETEKIFTQLIRSIEKIRSEVTELIGAKEKAAVNQAEGLMKKLEQEIAELKQLSETEDHIYFLQNFQSLSAPPVTGILPSATVNPDVSFESVRKAVSQLKEHIEDFCKGELVKITKTVNEVEVYSLQEPRTRTEFLKYSRWLTLDPNTMHRYLHLYEGNRKVICRKGHNHPYPDHPERFDYMEQVLCREGLSGTRCYWEIEWSGGGAAIGVTYKGISRKGADRSCSLGYNDKSWSLLCSGSSYLAQHNNKYTAITAPRSPRIGVYLDFIAGTLSFYGVSGDTMTLLHRFQTTFTEETLYPAFGPMSGSGCMTYCSGSSVTICNQLE
ncbi:tripartite motif-containing protein 16-like protein [Polyodon spathula]|uniref:tripartite motif-containing protein 16-like protein n=1 Tax=Polyodon spathula TaxID=7913 RepID=UPI001B7E8A1D|nr:tripartite motif-containing protein 16-like protein [Polyodon spathula]